MTKNENIICSELSIEGGEEWKEWLAKVMSLRPHGNMYLDSPRGIEVTKMCLAYEKSDFSWHRSDEDTFWIDVQCYVKYKLSNQEILFIMKQQPGVENYSKHAAERNAYAEFMRGLTKLRNINYRKKYGIMKLNDFIDNAARQHADLHFVDEAVKYLNEPWDKAKDRYAKTLADFAKFCIRHRWISVDDRLPENDGYVLVYVNGDLSFGTTDRHEVAYYDGEDWYTQEGEHIRPSHWCEIPQLNLVKE